MIVDGKKIAQHIESAVLKEIQKGDKKLSLAVFVLMDSPATQQFVAVKTRVGELLGVNVELFSLQGATRTEELVQAIQSATKNHNGIIVQFPLPEHIDVDIVRNTIPTKCDVDVVSDAALKQFKEGGIVLPPVVGAIDAILKEYDIVLRGKCVVVVGEGRLVGKPSALYARRAGAHVLSVNAKSYDISFETKKADVLILGAGVPGLIRPDMIKEGVAILDAGTSEESGEVKGDADPTCGEKASFYTPVPGGIGPITVAVIFRNLLALSRGRTT